MVYNYFSFPMHTTKTIPPDTNDLPTQAESDCSIKTDTNNSDKIDDEDL
ncbi:hypothetical protein [Terribacillus saccharophilus]